MRNNHSLLFNRKRFLSNELTKVKAERALLIELIDVRYARLKRKVNLTNHITLDFLLATDRDMPVLVNRLILTKLVTKAIEVELKDLKLRIKNTQKKFEKNLVKSN